MLLLPPEDKLGLDGRLERGSGLEMDVALREEEAVGSRPESLEELPSREKRL